MSFTNRNLAKDEVNVVAFGADGDELRAVCDRAGVPYVHQADLTAAKDTVSTAGKALSQSRACVASTTITTSSQTLSANASRGSLSISNDMNQKVYVRAGTVAASATEFDWVVQSGSTLQLTYPPKEAIQAFTTASAGDCSFSEGTA